jgi:hypothetical protein
MGYLNNNQPNNNIFDFMNTESQIFQYSQVKEEKEEIPNEEEKISYKALLENLHQNNEFVLNPNEEEVSLFENQISNLLIFE